MSAENRRLRNGYTTGSAATLAARAAMYLLLTGNVPEKIDVPLPPFADSASGAMQPSGRVKLMAACAGFGAAPGLELPLERVAVHAGAIKDGGDDPDATDGMMIYATLYAVEPQEGGEEFLRIHGGPGIGVATAPGLPVPIGAPAINPAPRGQISFALRELYVELHEIARFQPPFELVISAPEGEARAARTLNGRLGIKGGISILGTHGIVRPYSHAAFGKAVSRQIDFAVQNGISAVCLATGRRSESLLKALHPDFPVAAFIQVADLARFSLSRCGGKFKKIIWGCFFGKLLKLAQGFPNTHAYEEAQNLEILRKLAFDKELACAKSLVACATAQGCLDLLLEERGGRELVLEILRFAKDVAEKFAAAPVKIYLFNLDGTILGVA